MLVKFNDITWDKETVELYKRTGRSSATVSKQINSPKYLVIDWRGVDPTTIDFENLYNLEVMDDGYDEGFINDDEVLKAFFRFRETSNEEFLWSYLVDDNIISDEVYQKNTYEENLNIMCKVRKIEQGLPTKK